MAARPATLRTSVAPGPSLARVILAGVIGGLVATGAKTLCEVLSPPRPPGVPSPLANAMDVVANRSTGLAMPAATKAIAEPAVHFAFGTLAGGAYAGLARYVPPLAAAYGALFGVSFWLLVHEGALPLMGLSPTPAAMTAREQRDELVSHTVYGVVLDSVRRSLLRKWA